MSHFERSQESTTRDIVFYSFINASLAGCKVLRNGMMLAIQGYPKSTLMLAIQGYPKSKITSQKTET